MNIRTLSIILTLPLLASTSFAQAPSVGLTQYEKDVYAASEAYVNDPQWAGVALDTSHSLKKKKCVEGHFFKMGFNRAYNSKKREKGLKKIKKKCKKVDVIVDETAYFAGYDKGQLARCGFAYGLRHGRGGNDLSWTICSSSNLENFHKGYEIGQDQAPILNQRNAKKQRVTHLEDKIVLLEYDMNNGTDTAEIGDGKKTDYLVRWNRELKNARATVIKLEARNPEVFDTSELREKNAHFQPKHWKDVP